jgi:hypothetical protein
MKAILFLLTFLTVSGFAQRYELVFKKIVTTRAEDVREPLTEKSLSDCIVVIDTDKNVLVIKEKDKETTVKIKDSFINENDVLNLSFEHDLYLKGFLSKKNGKFSLILTVKEFTYHYYV